MLWLLALVVQLQGSNSDESRSTTCVLVGSTSACQHYMGSAEPLRYLQRTPPPPPHLHVMDNMFYNLFA